ncbi:AMP-binding protein, partial [Bifidobacterium sp. UBA744]|uniref:AMP-binding protein n=1 Tax=Bifidobacterium sp. UBA744 TaxID=1946112 RepID=UPI0025C5E4C7
MLKEFVEPIKYTTTEADTVFSLLARRAKRNPDETVAEWQDEKTFAWHQVSAGEMLGRAREVAKGLLALGATKGERVIVYSPTCYSWGVVDFACAAIGAVLVPIYETDSIQQASNIIDEVKPIVAFCGDFDHAQALEQIRDNHGNTLRNVFNFKAEGLDAVADFGRGVSDATLDAAIASITADDVLTIVYTSGSTGRPKGAMLSNRNYTHIVLNGYEILPNMLYNDNRLLLFLPLAHCFARYIQYVAIGGHGVIGYLPGAKRLLADLRSF